MRLTLKQSGGFAGIEQEPVRVDSDRLAPALREQLPALLDAAPPAVVGADLPRFELTVEDGGAVHALTWHDDGSEAVAALRALADEVKRAADQAPHAT